MIYSKEYILEENTVRPKVVSIHFKDFFYSFLLLMQLWYASLQSMYKLLPIF